MSELKADYEDLKFAGVEAYKKRQFPQAIEFFTQATELDSSDPVVWELLGTSQLRSSLLHDAVDSFQQAIEKNPHRSISYINIGAIFNRLGEFDKAIDFLQRGLQRDKRSIEGYYNLGLAYRRLDDFELAITAIKQVLRLNPLEWDAFYQLGKIYRDQGKTNLEIQYYHKALDLEPGNKRVLKSLELAKRQRTAQAQEINAFGRLVDDAPLRQTNSTTMLPALTVPERLHDREIVRLCAIAAEYAAVDYMEFLQGEGRQILDKLKTRVSSGKSYSNSFRELHQDYRKTARDIAARRTLVNQKMLQLQNHENQVLAQMEAKLQ